MYVCFDDDEQLDTFFIFSESRVIREFMVGDGGFARMPKDFQERFKKDFLIVRQYDKGVAIGERDFTSQHGDN